jgi:hypothetical protein
MFSVVARNILLNDIYCTCGSINVGRYMCFHILINMFTLFHIYFKCDATR